MRRPGIVPSRRVIIPPSLHRPCAVRVTQPPACVVLSRERGLAVRGERRRTTRRERDPAARGRECFTGPDSGESRVGDLTRTMREGRCVRICPAHRHRARLSGALALCAPVRRPVRQLDPILRRAAHSSLFYHFKPRDF